MKKVEKSIPPNIVIPTVSLLAAPGPVPIIRGSTPITVDKLVIRIGLSLIAAAAAIRLRPILMTSLSTVIGVLPLIIGTGPGAASRLTVGITIFGGMLFSTFFTLYVIPTIYTIIGKNTKRIDAVEIDLNKQLKK